MAKIKVGDQAPPFKLQDQSGRFTDLYSHLLTKGPILLVFYPGDFTPVCTKQLCDYRDHYLNFNQIGVQVVGISADSQASHEKFSKRYTLPFPILSDPDLEVSDKYCVKPRLNLFGGSNRALFLVSKDGSILYSYVEKLALFRRRSEDILRAISGVLATSKNSPSAEP